MKTKELDELSKQPKVLVIGDFMWDRYWCGTSNRLSAEAPVPVVKIEKTFMVPGGAGNVKANLEALGAEVRLVSGVGTIVKNRLMIGDVQVARWDENDRLEPIEPQFVKDQLDWADGVVVSDYDKGSITREIIDSLYCLDIPKFVDTKRDPEEFPLTSIFFPNHQEYIRYSFEYNRCRSMILKRGAEGLVGYWNYKEIVIGMKAAAKFVRSVNGAGDSTIAGYCFAALNQMSPDKCLDFAGRCAAVVVQKPYTAVASYEEVVNFGK